MDFSLGNVAGRTVPGTGNPGKLAQAHGPLVLLALAFLALAMGILLMASFEAEAYIVGDLPPASGDWVVDSPTMAGGETIDVRGDLVVKSTLILNNCQVRVHSASDGGFGINVTSDGMLTANSTKFTSGGGHTYTFVVRGRLTARGATFEDCEGGVRVLTDKTVTIEGSYILDPTEVGLYLEGADGTTVTGLLVRSDGRDIHARLSVDATTDGHLYELDAPTWKAVQVRGGSPTLADLEVSFNGTLYADVDITKRCARPVVRLNCLWAFLDIETRDALEVTGALLRDSTLGLNVTFNVDNKVTEGNITTAAHMFQELISLRNYRNVTLRKLGVRDLVRDEIALHNTTSGNPCEIYYERWDKGVILVDSDVDDALTTVGPHTFRLHLRDIECSGVYVLGNDLEPTYTGTQVPSFRIETVIDNITASRSQNIIRLYLHIHDYYGGNKDIDSYIRISNSSFSALRGSVTSWAHYSATATDARYLELDGLFLVENCTLDRNLQIDDPLFVLPVIQPNEFSNINNRGAVFRNNVFSNNSGMLLYVGGHAVYTKGHEWVTIENNVFRGNGAREDEELFNLSHRDRVLIANNTFEDNFCSVGFWITDAGGNSIYRAPCNIWVLNNTFRGNTAYGTNHTPRGMFDVVWGGHLEVAWNEFSHSDTMFFNLTEYPDFSIFSTADFHHNEVHHVNNSIVHLYNSDQRHEKLSVKVRDNTIWDIDAPLLDYRPDERWWFWDYDATVLLANNTVTRSTGTVFKCYGNITIKDNAFTDCGDYTVRVEAVWKHPPKLSGNTFYNCTNALWVGAKDQVPTEALIWITDEHIDCTGTALYFYRMEATVERVTITDNASEAIVAERSFVDTYDSYMADGSGRVVWSGAIRVWFNVEVRVEWANAAGVGSGNPVPDATVSFYNSTGNWSASNRTDAAGRTAPVPLMRWFMTLSPDAYAIAAPYDAVASVSSFRSNATLDLNGSRLGADALHILLVDPVLPDITLDHPSEGDMFNTTYILVGGFASDLGSGVFQVEITIHPAETYGVMVSTLGEFEYNFTDVPEGTLAVHVRVLDVALNERSVSVTVRVDRTPPWLTLHSPADGTVTNVTSVRVRGAHEPGADLRVNLREFPASPGTFDLVLSLIEGDNRITVTATDAFGNTARVTANLVLDTVEPDLELLAPKDGYLTNSETVDAEGYVSGHALLVYTVHRMYYDIIDEPIEAEANGFFSHPIPLEEGENVIIIKALDEAGNAAWARRVVTLDTTPPLLEIMEPKTGLLTNEKEVHVVGEVDADATLYLDGKLLHNPGSIDRTVVLSEGDNVLEFVAVDEAGNEAVVTVSVRLDTVAPTIELERPASINIRTNVGTVVVEGRVGTDTQVLTVHGIAVSVAADGAFYHEVVLASDGTHTIIVNARDWAGNVAQVMVWVELDTTPPAFFVTFRPAEGIIKDARGVLEVHVTTDASADSVELLHTQEDSGWAWNMTYPLGGGTTAYVHNLKLLEGRNAVTVSVVDDLGNTNSTRYVVTWKHNPPSEVEAYSTALVIGLVVVLLVVAIGVAYLYMRRRG